MIRFASGLALATGMALAVFLARPPLGSDASADPVAYQDSNVLAHVGHIAERAHPLGSADHERVREYVVAQFRALGLDCEVQGGLGLDEPGDGTAVVAGNVKNVIATLRGRDASLPALLLMSHYDSVPNSPAAADDGLGVATALEIARALSVGPRPARDVVFLVSDGEEAGLLGAEFYFSQTGLPRHLGAVINMEARGDAGRVHLFETGPGSARLVALYGSLARHPDANSFAAFVYHRMPNGTDMTHAIGKGLPALNFAMIGDELAYHTGLATAAHLDRATLHHMGAQVFPVARALALASSWPHAGGNEIYTDLFGRFFIHYGVTAGWVLFSVAGLLILWALWRACCIRRFERVTAARATAAWLLLLLMAAQYLWWAGRLYDALEHEQRLPHLGVLLVGCVLGLVGLFYLCLHASTQASRSWLLPAISLGLTLGAQIAGVDTVGLMLGMLAMLAWVMLRWRAHDTAPLQVSQIWMVALACNLLLFLLVQALAAEATSVLMLQCAGAALCAVLVFVVGRGSANRYTSTLIWVLAVAALAQSGMVALFLFDALGMDLPIVLLLPWLAALPVVLPLLLPGQADAAHRPIGAIVLLMAGIAAIGYSRFAGPSADAPASTALMYVEDVDKREAYLVGDLAAADGYVRGALGKGYVHGALPMLGADENHHARTVPAAVLAPGLELSRNGDVVTVHLTRPPGAQQLTLRLRSAQLLKPQHLNDRSLRITPAAGAEITYILVGPEDSGLVLTLLAPAGPVSLELNARAWFDSWPQGAAPLPGLPPGYVVSGRHGYTLAVRNAKFNL